MEVFRGIKRRMELFETFAEGKELLRGRRISAVRGGVRARAEEEEASRALRPAVLVRRGARGSGGVRKVTVEIFTEETELAYAMAEEIEDYLAAILGFRRTGLRDERRGEQFLLCLVYVFPDKEREDR